MEYDLEIYPIMTIQEGYGIKIEYDISIPMPQYCDIYEKDKNLE